MKLAEGEPVTDVVRLGSGGPVFVTVCDLVTRALSDDEGVAVTVRVEEGESVESGVSDQAAVVLTLPVPDTELCADTLCSGESVFVAVAQLDAEANVVTELNPVVEGEPEVVIVADGVRVGCSEGEGFAVAVPDPVPLGSAVCVTPTVKDTVVEAETVPRKLLLVKPVAVIVAEMVPAAERVRVTEGDPDWETCEAVAQAVLLRSVVRETILVLVPFMLEGLLEGEPMTLAVGKTVRVTAAVGDTSEEGEGVLNREAVTDTEASEEGEGLRLSMDTVGAPLAVRDPVPLAVVLTLLDIKALREAEAAPEEEKVTSPVPLMVTDAKMEAVTDGEPITDTLPLPLILSDTDTVRLIGGDPDTEGEGEMEGDRGALRDTEREMGGVALTFGEPDVDTVTRGEREDDGSVEAVLAVEAQAEIVDDTVPVAVEFRAVPEGDAVEAFEPESLRE